jgi:hypothetical protein
MGSCGTVSDQYSEQLKRNPGAGITLSGGRIWANVNGQQTYAGTYTQTSIDWTLNEFLRQTGDRADAMLKAGTREMATNAVITAAYFAQSSGGGTQTTSKTLFNKDGVRVDVENPAPQRRPGQVHLQIGKEKYIYDSTTGELRNAPPRVQTLLERDEIQKAIQKGLRFLGEEE